MCEAAHGGKLLVDGIGGQTSGFQVHAVAHDDDAIEGQTGLGAIPCDELIDGVLVNAARGWRTQAVEYRQSAMIQIRQPKHAATVVRLDSLFAHGDGLQCRGIWDDGDHMDDSTKGRGDGVLSAMAWFQQSAAGVDDRGLRSGSQNRAESRCCGSPCSLAEAFSAIGDCLFDRSGQDALVPVGAGEP